MFTGYLQLGGAEIANTDRLVGYAATSECPNHWVVQQTCGTLQDALGDGAYVASNISTAPWYDPTRSELSSKFLGVSIIDAANRYDSTREVPVTESVGSGGVIGAPRNATKSIEFTSRRTLPDGAASASPRS